MLTFECVCLRCGEAFISPVVPAVHERSEGSGQSCGGRGMVLRQRGWC